MNRDKVREVLHSYLAGAPTRVVLDDIEACIEPPTLEEILTVLDHHDHCDRVDADDPDIGWCYRMREIQAGRIRELLQPKVAAA